jgi:hypothetical protein
LYREPVIVRPDVYQIAVLQHNFAVCRLHADLALPEWVSGGALVCVTRTPDELSIVCYEELVPGEVTSVRGWRCLRVEGELDLSSIGVLKSILEPLAVAAIPVFVVSTFATDYVLVKAIDLERALRSLVEAGFEISRR